MEELKFIGNVLKPLELEPEFIVIQEGSNSSSLFFTVKGRLSVNIKDFSGGDHIRRTLDKNSIFGEISYLLKCRRTATITCGNYVSLL